MSDITLIDMLPNYNPVTLKWEIGESDKDDNPIEVHCFDTSEEADAFVDQWIETRDNRSAGLW